MNPRLNFLFQGKSINVGSLKLCFITNESTTSEILSIPLPPHLVSKVVVLRYDEESSSLFPSSSQDLRSVFSEKSILHLAVSSSSMDDEFPLPRQRVTKDNRFGSTVGRLFLPPYQTFQTGDDYVSSRLFVTPYLDSRLFHGNNPMSFIITFAFLYILSGNI